MSAQGNSWTANWGLVPLRLVVGLVFIVHGGQKLFVFGLGGAAGFMAKVGIPWPFLAAVVVIAVEILGGLALVLGLGTRLAAALLAGAAVLPYLGSGAAEAQTPKRGGVLRLTFQVDPLHFDPHQTLSFATMVPLSFAYSRLLKVKAGVTVKPMTYPIEPDLAE